MTPCCCPPPTVHSSRPASLPACRSNTKSASHPSTARLRGPLKTYTHPATSPRTRASSTGYANGGQNGLVTIDTPPSQALIGFVKAQGKSVSNLAADVNVPFCQILLNSMDERPIAASGRLLLITGSAVRNTGQTWNSAHTDVTNWGESPTLIQQVKGTITLRGIQGARSISIQPIDGAGHPLGQPVSAIQSGTEWKLPIGAIPTTWYQITVTH